VLLLLLLRLNQPLVSPLQRCRDDALLKEASA